MPGPGPEGLDGPLGVVLDAGHEVEEPHRVGPFDAVLEVGHLGGRAPGAGGGGVGCERKSGFRRWEDAGAELKNNNLRNGFDGVESDE